MSFSGLDGPQGADSGVVLADPVVLAVAVETSRLAAGLVTRGGNVLVRDRVTTPHRDVWRTLDGLVRRVIAAAPGDVPRPSAIGVSCVGPVDGQAGSVSPPMVPAWANFPLREHLERLANLPVVLETAGAAATEAERWLGEAQDVASYVCIRIDRTVESGCVIGGARLSGARGNAGSIAHINVEPDGRPCWCGARGCLEPYVSSTLIEAEINRPLGRANASIVDRTGIMLGRAIASITATLDVSTVFLSGNVLDTLGDPLLESVRRELHLRSRLDSLTDLRIIEPHDRVNAVVAAASLVRDLAVAR